MPMREHDLDAFKSEPPRLWRASVLWRIARYIAKGGQGSGRAAACIKAARAHARTHA
eukprot:CAMPEP_0175346320 /NCGR_PEP_ID=MMETSP0095-20121207/8814_1 /TAXON_ID=311494 /ORGANISM="Alexandrium monilatum, Strain CCMP3105" /LENGTH=56 /DNA_ID=CAMNT_0016643799 /DNA_START=187 /DNA_END=355 /DNA_ORIENTATION=+